jgi:hypothetical protein
LVPANSPTAAVMAPRIGSMLLPPRYTHRTNLPHRQLTPSGGCCGQRPAHGKVSTATGIDQHGCKSHTLWQTSDASSLCSRRVQRWRATWAHLSLQSRRLGHSVGIELATSLRHTAYAMHTAGRAVAVRAAVETPPIAVWRCASPAVISHVVLHGCRSCGESCG